jgi:type II secretory pathway pseudopilin PulG
MSNTKKEQQRKDEDMTPTTVTNTQTTTSSSSPSQIKQQQQQAVNKAIDETKDNIRRAADEARKDIPRYTQAVNEYHEHTIQVTVEMTNYYLESQKEIINSFQSAWVPAIERTYAAFWNYWMSPRTLTDIYTRTVSNIADNTIATTRLVNNAIFSNLEVFKTSIHVTGYNVKEFSRIGVNAARTFEQTSRDTTATIGSKTELSSS